MGYCLSFLLLLGALSVLDVRADFSLNDALAPETLVGEARLKVLFWNVFDARLHAPDAAFDPEAPFALSLSYLRKLKAAKIIEKSIEEMASQPSTDRRELSRWKVQLAAIIPDVRDGTTITGLRDEDGNAIFYRDDELIGRIDDPAFSRSFFGIWLGEATSEPDLRRGLLGKD